MISRWYHSLYNPNALQFNKPPIVCFYTKWIHLINISDGIPMLIKHRQLKKTNKNIKIKPSGKSLYQIIEEQKKIL